MIPSTNSKSRAMIPTQKEPRANEPRATNEPSAINGSRAIMPNTNSGPRALNSNSNTKRIDPKRDL